MGDGDHDLLTRWGQSLKVLLGDAGHPMTQYMAKGAATSMEDAVLLARCVEATPDDIPSAFRRYERARRARTSQIQGTSQTEHPDAGKDRSRRVYGYDAWTAPLPSVA